MRRGWQGAIGFILIAIALSLTPARAAADSAVGAAPCSVAAGHDASNNTLVCNFGLTPEQLKAAVKGATEAQQEHLDKISETLGVTKSATKSVLLLGLRVSGVFEVCGAFGGRILGEDFAAGLADGFVTSRPDLSEQGLELCEDLFDGVEVGGVFRQEHQAGSDISDRLAHRLSFVGSEIVEDDDVARLQSRHEELIDIGAETLAVDGSVKQAGRVDAVVAQGGEERRGLPLALRNLVDEALSLRRPAAKPCHVGLRPGLIDEDQTPGINAPLVGAPARAMAAYVRAILFTRDEGLFLTVTPILRKKRLIIEVSALTPRSADRRSHRA